MPCVNRQFVETKRFTVVELYGLRRAIIKHSRSIPPGFARMNTADSELRGIRHQEKEVAGRPYRWIGGSR